MPQSKLLEERISYVVRQVDDGASVEDACRKTGVSVQAYYLWRKRYGRLVPGELVRWRSLEEENRQLKQTIAELSFTKQLLQATIEARVRSDSPNESRKP